MFRTCAACLPPMAKPELMELSDRQVLEEFQNRQLHVINTYIPSDKEGHNQLSYHNSKAVCRLLFGGNQSGKSHAAAYDCAVNARGENPFISIKDKKRDYVIWVISAEYLTIKNGIYRHLRDIIPNWDIVKEGPRIPGHNLPSFIEIKRKSGYITTISFMSAKGDSGARSKFQAAAVDYFYIDEEISEDIWEELQVRTLATGGSFSISATLVESFDWLLKLEKDAEDEDKNVFLTRLNTELNPYLDKATVERLKKTFSKETLEYRYYGKARAAMGLIYSNFDKHKHLVRPFKIPYDWPRWCAIDPGIRTCAALWIAVNPDNIAYAYRELYAHNEPLWVVAKEIKQLEGWKLNKELSKSFSHYVWEETDSSETMVSRLIDPKSRARSEAGEASILDQLSSRYGLICTPADNAVRPGLEDCRYWLEDGMFFFNNLNNFVDEIKSYRYRPINARRDQNAPIEDPIRRSNHLMDCWRYIARDKPDFKYSTLAEHNQYMSTVERIERKRKEHEYCHDELGSEW